MCDSLHNAIFLAYPFHNAHGHFQAFIEAPRRDRSSLRAFEGLDFS